MTVCSQITLFTNTVRMTIADGFLLLTVKSHITATSTESRISVLQLRANMAFSFTTHKTAIPILQISHTETATQSFHSIFTVMIQSFIKDADKGIDPKGFESVSNGSWFTAYKVENDKVWESIKSGEFKGFSVEGLFELEEYDELDELINEIL